MIAKFTKDNESTEIPIQIANSKEMLPSQIIEVVKSGFREAVIAKLTEGSEDTETKAQRNLLSPNFNPLAAKGASDSIKPKYCGAYTYAKDITRYASGWAYDSVQANASIWVHFYGRKKKEVTTPLATYTFYIYAYIGAIYANLPRDDVNEAYNITGNHGWKTEIPENWDADGVRENEGVCTVGGYGHIIRTCRAKFMAVLLMRVSSPMVLMNFLVLSVVVGIVANAPYLNP
jgi:hypothetical protein